MSPSAIVDATRVDGVNLALSPMGEIEVTGDDATLDRWLPLIREHKSGIVAVLQEAANDTAPTVPVPATQDSDELFAFAPPGDPANDDEALQERVAIMAVENGWDEDRALQEARWTVDRERCWRGFLRNAERILDAPGAKHGAMISIYKTEAIRRYGESTGTDMALSLASWVRARRVH